MSFIPIEYIASIIRKIKPINDVATLKGLFNKLEHLKARIHIKELDLLKSFIEKRTKNRELFPLIDKWISNSRREILEIIKDKRKKASKRAHDEKIKIENEKKRILKAVAEARKFLDEKGKDQIDIDERSNIDKHEEEYRVKKSKEAGTHIYDSDHPSHNENEDEVASK